MPTLLNAADRAALRTRIASLDHEAQPRWGRMSVGEMMAHLIDSFAIGFAERETVAPKSFLNTWLGRWLVIDSPMPWPKGKVKGPEDFFTTPPGAFEADRERVLVYLDRFGDDPATLRWGISPGFGALDGRQWGRLQWRHTNHHLRQFGA